MFKNPSLLLVATIISLTPIQVQSEQVIDFDSFSLPSFQVQNEPIKRTPGVKCLFDGEKLVKRINTNIVICQDSVITDTFKYTLKLYRFNITNGVSKGLNFATTMLIGNDHIKLVLMADYFDQLGTVDQMTKFILYRRSFHSWVSGKDNIPDPQFLKEHQQYITLLLDTHEEIMSQTPNLF
ncbi:MAG: hypothetical protein QNJ34_28385 [Xenococcaceae cyanobacterium MO_188.B29]|nr:hypothetical protein [Xenococcaceae cyanobacterium MO_188.B29]